mgnify:CR=1 FL=1
MFDISKEVLIKGTVARFDWMNPHMYLVVETKDPDGKPALIEGEGLGRLTVNCRDDLKRTWERETRLELAEMGRTGRAKQLSGKYMPS